MSINRIIPILVLVGVVIIGFVGYFIKLVKINDKLEFTVDYKDKFVEYCNSILEKKFNQELYNFLTENVNKMQIELGKDGIIDYIQDGLKGIAGRNYQILINTLPETREYYTNTFLQGPILYERIVGEIHLCDDCFLRHIGTLRLFRDELIASMKNPIKLFVNGVSFILSLPVKILNMFGIVSNKNETSFVGSTFFRLLSSIISLVGFISNVISIFLGWNEFFNIIKNLF